MIEDINAFCTIAKYQSFSKAARELGISTPVITRRLARLEQSLEVRLLTRTTRKVTLTEAGNLFYSEVNDVLHALEASKESVKALATQTAGVLKVAVPSSLNQCFIMPALKDFLVQYPNLKIQLASGQTHIGLLNEGFDLVILCGEMPHSSYYYKKIFTMKKVICASPEYLQKHSEPKTPEDLEKHNCLSFHDHFQDTWMIEEKGVKKDIVVHGNIQVDNGIDLKNLAVNGLGIAYLPTYLVHSELQKGKLVSILNDYQYSNYSLYAVYPAKKYLTKKTQLFLNFVINLLSDACGC